MSILVWWCLQLSCKLNLDRTVYTVFQNIRYSSKNLNVLNTVFSKQNISCFEIRWPRQFDQLMCLLICNSAQQLTLYRAQRKHINYSIWPMRISRPDSRRRYSKWWRSQIRSDLQMPVEITFVPPLGIACRTIVWVLKLFSFGIQI
jgi:hypothetical protein